jgi:transcriptional regulator with XRE-family HTH domain
MAMTDRFNENLKKLRLDAGLKQVDVAKKIGVAKNTYCKWELGTREPDIMKIKALAKLYGVSVDYLLDLTDKKAPYPCKK